VLVQTPNGNTTKIFLPFKGDFRLTAILSKAFLLAEDVNVTGEYSLSQM